MRMILTVPAVIVTAFGAAAHAQATAEEGDIQAVISAQIMALQEDDFDQAFTHASPMIQRIFGTSENFGQMVRKGYPMVWRPDDVRFLGAEETGATITQDVMIRDAEGKLHILEYEMIDGDAGWKINGVRMKPSVDGTA